MPDYRAERFVKEFRLTDDEIIRFKIKYIDDSNVLQAIAYYQEKDKDAYSLDKTYQYMRFKNGF